MMSIQSTIDNSSVVANSRVLKPRMAVRGLAIGVALMFSSALAQGQAPGTPQSEPGVVQADVKLVIGGDPIKNKSKVTLSVVGNSLHVAAKKATMDVSAASILDISTNEDSRQDITGAAKVATMAIPYGGSRVLSLFSHKVDVLTLEFTDANGGYRGAIFVLAQGQAAPIKKQLVAMGAKASAPLDTAPPDSK